MLNWKMLLRSATMVAAIGAVASASAQTFPTKAVTLVVPFAPGGPTDGVARALAPLMEQAWKQPFVVENRPGAGGVVGTEFVARANPDGYTILFNGNGVHTAKIFSKTLPYEPNDLRAIVELAGSDYIIVTHPSIPAKNLMELVTWLKEKGKSVNAGSIPLTAYDLDYHVFNRTTGTSSTIVPYNGAAPIVTAILRNDVNWYFAVPVSVVQHLESKALNPIAITGTRRLARFPNIPTTHEQGVAFDAGFAFGIWVPTKTPDAIVQKMQADMEKAVLSAQFGDLMKKFNYDVPAKPREYGARIQREVKTYFETAAQVGVKPQ